MNQLSFRLENQYGWGPPPIPYPRT